jgi:hypothetical protein
MSELDKSAMHHSICVWTQTAIYFRAPPKCSDATPCPVANAALALSVDLSLNFCFRAQFGQCCR